MIVNNNKKERSDRIVDFAVPADHKVKLKESEKRDKYHDLARETSFVCAQLNNNEELLHITKSFRSGASLSDAVEGHTHNTS